MSSGARTVSIARWNVAGAFLRPNGMTLNSNRPPGKMNAVRSLLDSATGICQ